MPGRPHSVAQRDLRFNIAQRDLRFDFSQVDMHSWHPAGFHASHYFNAQSLLFPQGERFFIRSVRHYRQHIDNPALASQIGGFIGQEAAHGREHEAYNERLTAFGYAPEKFDRMLARNFRFIEKHASPLTCLAVTAGLEHITAVTADSLLDSPQAMEGSHPEMQRLWFWHCLEESEHKSVAFDVYREVSGGGISAWLRRCLTYLFASIGIQFCIWVMLIRITAKHKRLLDLPGWGRLMKLLWLKPGIIRREIPHYFQYYLPGFHPWDIDNSQRIEAQRASYDEQA